MNITKSPIYNALISRALLSIFIFGLIVNIRPATGEETEIPTSESGVSAGTTQPSDEFQEEFLFFTDEDMASISSFRIKPISASPGFVTVITSKTIASMAARNLTDVLRMVPGFSIHYGNFGEYSVSITGNDNPSNTLLMINGHRLNNFYDGSPMYDLPVDGIERIEIIRGPGSAMYGTNAMAGVINVVTAKNGASAFKAGIGNFNTKKANVSYGSKTESGSVSLFAEVYDTAGADTVMPYDRLSNNTTTSPYSKAPATMRDNRTKTMAVLGWDHYKTSANFVFLNEERGPNYAYQNIISGGSTVSSRYFSLDIAHPFGSADSMLVEPRLYGDLWSFDKKIQLYPNGYTDNRDLDSDGLNEYFPNGEWLHKKYDVLTYGGEVKAMTDLTPSNHLTVGFTVEESSIRNTSVLTNYSGEPDVAAIPKAAFANWNNYGFSPYSRTLWAAYLQDDISIGKHINLVAGIRQDHYSDFGDSTNPRVALGIYPADSVDIKFQYASAFRAPTFRELYDKSDMQFYGNPKLLPESAETYEAGAGYTWAPNGHIRAGVYRNILKNYITTLFNSSMAAATEFQNAGVIEVNGQFVEARHSFPDGSQIGVNASLFGARDKISNTWLTRIPQYRFNASYSRRVFGDAYLAVDYSHSDGAVSNARTNMEQLSSNVSSAGPFSLVNLALSKRNFFSSGLNAKISVFNLLNNDFREMYSDIRYMFPNIYGANSNDNLVKTNQRLLLVELEKGF